MRTGNWIGLILVVFVVLYGVAECRSGPPRCQDPSAAEDCAP